MFISPKNYNELTCVIVVFQVPELLQILNQGFKSNIQEHICSWVSSSVLHHSDLVFKAAAAKVGVDQADLEVQDNMRRLNSNSEDRSRLTTALSCLKSANDPGEDHPGFLHIFCNYFDK